MAFSFDLDNKGYIKKRESYNLEYKQNFQLGDNLVKYCKTLVGMANNKGGEIVFGIKNSPHELFEQQGYSYVNGETIHREQRTSIGNMFKEQNN